jgi:hypothetical protein
MPPFVLEAEKSCPTGQLFSFVRLSGGQEVSISSVSVLTFPLFQSKTFSGWNKSEIRNSLAVSLGKQ